MDWAVTLDDHAAAENFGHLSSARTAGQPSVKVINRMIRRVNCMLCLGPGLDDAISIHPVPIGLH